MTRSLRWWVVSLVVLVVALVAVVQFEKSRRSAAEARRLADETAARAAAEARRLVDETVAIAAADPGLAVDLGGGITMKMVAIEPGRFMMGSPEQAWSQHEVTITKGFWLCQTEVTQAQWQAVMGNNPSGFQGDLNRPVERVSWNDAIEFCTRLSEMKGMEFRLPTEAEWEYACRAGTTTAFSSGDDASVLQEYAWFDANSGNSRTEPVATRKPNPWGLYDMHGNVWEWVSDWHGAYQDGPQTDPVGPSSGTARVFRGGSWNNSADNCRSWARASLAPDFVGLGFRVARTR